MGFGLLIRFGGHEVESGDGAGEEADDAEGPGPPAIGKDGHANADKKGGTGQGCEQAGLSFPRGVRWGEDGRVGGGCCVENTGRSSGLGLAGKAVVG